MRRLVGPVVVFLLAGALVAGCSASGSSSSGADGAVRSDAAAAGSGQVGASLTDAAGTTGAAPTVDRQVVTTGSVGIVVAKPAVAAQRASEITEAAGGRVDTRVEQAASGDQDATAHLVVRIPAQKLTATLSELKALGKVDRIELTATDVTDKVQDLDARITALTVSVGRLETLMGTASTSTDLVALESALSTRQSDLESMQAQRAGLAGQVALTTISLDLTQKATVVAASSPGFWSGLVSGWDALLTTLAAALVVVGVLLPWFAFGGVLALAGIALTRLVRSRRAHPGVAALASAAAEVTPPSAGA